MSRSDSTSPESHAATSETEDFRPTATLPMLRLRADMLHWVRQFFRHRGYWEVETPLLSHDVCVDAWLEPFCVSGQTQAADREFFLQTSPEFGMKRLLASGADSIFQITRAFRQEETGRLHNPEFTIVEWYRVGDSYRDQMEFVSEFVCGFQAALRDVRAKHFPEDVSGDRAFHPLPELSRPVCQLSYDEAFACSWGQPVLGRTTSDLVQLARQRGIVPPRSLREDDRDGWLNLLFLEVVEPMLAERQSAFVYDYPASQAALAQIREDDPPVAERFELFLQGTEICNGYQELTDPTELRRRVREQTQKRDREGRRRLPAESRLLSAMEAGLPECAGVALGFDRLLMVLSGAASIDEVMAFPFGRA